MRWINSYLSEVEQHLDAADRTDILVELRTTLEEQIDDLAGDGEATEAHQKQVITALGHPMKVAAGFNGPRYLIGPELFPTYWQTLRLVLVIVAVIQCALLLLAYVTTDWSATLPGVLRGTFDALLWASIVVTLVFIGLEALDERIDRYAGWTADRLSPNAGAPVSASDMITNLVSEGVFLLWWNGAIGIQNWLPGLSDALPVSPGPVWAALYWPLNVLVGAWFLLHAWVFARGLWSTRTLVAEIVLGIVGIAAAVWTLANPPLLAFHADMPEQSVNILTRVVTTVIVVIAGFTAWDVLAAVRRLRRRPADAPGGRAPALP
ncbi:MAG: hypothetical protein AAFU65_11890 [Pseudomonadota bacterium]